MSALRIERDGPLLRVTLARPQQRNAFDAELIAELTEAFAEVGDARAVVLTGEGPSFCAGADVEWQRASIDLSYEENVEDALRLYRMLEAVDECPAPVVAAVQGYALGGGSGLVACVDVAVAREDAVFGFSEVRLGIIPAVISPFVLRRIGPGPVRRLFLTGERFDAGTALRVGLVHEVAAELVPIAAYLDTHEHVRAAREAGADAVHPGYGFLAENADFAEAVEAAGITWVGPTSEALRAAGHKLEAKRLAQEAGVPVVPSGAPEEVGYPLIVKAAAGGGGRGMRVVRTPEELEDALEAARREAKAGFGDERVFCERYVERPRHVEIQLLADAHGDVVHLGERECSIQRRHQKVLEESPSPG